MALLAITPQRAHLTRLLAIWRSAGWPCHDVIELDLVAGGWLVRCEDGQGRQTVSLTPSGIELLAQSRQRQQRALSDHDRLAARMASHLCQGGRLVWRELSLRAHVADGVSTTTEDAQGAEGAESPRQQTLSMALEDDAGAPQSPRLAGRWRMARPDVFSVRRTSVEAYLHPLVHEVKVSRADLLSDLRDASKRASYQWLPCETHYVMPQGVADLAEIPAAFGVWWLHGSIDTGTLELMRPAQHVPCKLPFAVWMAMAQAAPHQTSPFDDTGVQGALQPVAPPDAQPDF